MKKITCNLRRLVFPAIFFFSVAMMTGLMYTDNVSSKAFKVTLKGESPIRPAEAVSESRRTTAMPVAPQYQIYDIGIVQTGDTASQGFGVSTGGIAVGRSVRSGGAQAFTWMPGSGIVGLPNLAGRAFCVSNGANNNGIVAGTCATTLFGTSRLPVVWQNGAASQLPLPAGETLGDASDVNASGVAVGSVNGGSLQRGVVYSGGNAIVITQTTSNGS